MKILAVDDDEIICELLTDTLCVAGFDNVTTAGSAIEALKILDDTTQPYDCFLLDIQMPEIDGIELCRRIRKNPQYYNAPILMITAMSDKKYIDAAFRAGASDYVTKPFDVMEVGSRVKVAQHMCASQKEAEQALNTAADLKTRLRKKEKCDLRDPIHLVDVDRCLDFSAFENYYLLLTRKQYLTTGLLAIKVENIRELHSICTEHEFSYAVSDFGEAISNVTDGEIDFLTYKGDGIFICAFAVAYQPQPEWLKTAITNEILDMGLMFSDGSAMPMIFSVGQPVLPGVFSSPGSDKLMVRAIDSLENVAGADQGDQTSGKRKKRQGSGGIFSRTG